MARPFFFFACGIRPAPARRPAPRPTRRPAPPAPDPPAAQLRPGPARASCPGPARFRRPVPAAPPAPRAPSPPRSRSSLWPRPRPCEAKPLVRGQLSELCAVFYKNNLVYFSLTWGFIFKEYFELSRRGKSGEKTLHNGTAAKSWTGRTGRSGGCIVYRRG